MSSIAITNLPAHVVDLYNRNFGQATQQLNSRLKPFVTMEPNLRGERKRFDMLAKRVNLEPRTGRANPTRRTDSTSTSRWLYADIYQDAVVIDQWDEELLGDITSPRSDVLTSMMAAVERTIDKRILTDLLADVRTGQQGTSTLTYSAGANQAVAANFSYNATTGAEETNGGRMSVDKIRKAREILGTAEAIGFGMSRGGADRPVLALRAKDKNSLFHDIQVTSGDYGRNLPYSDGVLEDFLGVKLVNTEQLYAASSAAWGIMWLPSAFHFHAGQWRTAMDILPDNSRALQVFVEGRIGGLRRYDERVVVVKATE